MYKDNSIIFDGGAEPLSGSEHDIATDTKSFRFSTPDNSTVKVGMTYGVFFTEVSLIIEINSSM